MPRQLALLPLLALAACAHHARVAEVAPPAPEPVVAEAPPAPPPPASPINAGLSPAATVWHLRAALNVAALGCRGADEAAIVGRYNALLGEQKVALAAAQAQMSAEFRAGGDPKWQDRYDTAMTKLYNFFSQPGPHARFCAVAAEVLAESATVAPDALFAFAETRLRKLDEPFAADLPQPVVMAAATPPRPFASPASPASPPAAQPRLELDLASLDH